MGWVVVMSWPAMGVDVEFVEDVFYVGLGEGASRGYADVASWGRRNGSFVQRYGFFPTSSLKNSFETYWWECSMCASTFADVVR